MSSKAASAQRPILGDSGPLQWSKKAKMSAQILKVIPLSFIVCRFVHQKLRLVPGIPEENKLHRAHDDLICHLLAAFLAFQCPSSV
jgi:hypothetical protein